VASRLEEIEAEIQKRQQNVGRLASIETELKRRAPITPDVSDIGPLQAGLIATGKGMTTIGRAGQQALNVLTGDEAAFQALQTRAQQEEQLFAPLEEAQPLATFIGEVLGETAALPVGGVGAGLLRRGATAAVSGAAAGAATELGRGGEDVGATAAIGAVLGPIGESIGALVQRFGGPAIDAIKKIITEKIGSVPPGLITPQGSITEQGEKLLSSLNINRQEFTDAFGGLTEAGRLQGLDPQAQLRVARAQTEGVPLTQGQATREFELQSGEDILKGLEGREGERARLFFNEQQKSLVDAKDTFLQKIGDDLETSRTARGEQVRTTLRDINSAEKIAISQLYGNLTDLPGGDQIIRTEVLKEFSDELVREIVPSTRIQRGIKNIFNDFEILDEPVKTATSQGPLRFRNAEKMRQRLNKLSPDNPADITVVAQLKQGLDDLVAAATEQFPSNTPIGQAAQNARSAARRNFERFSAKDIVENIISFRKGTTTDRVPDELILDKILASGNQKIANLKKIKSVLTTSPTNASRKAWEGIQTQAMLDLFSKAVTETPQGFVISGNKLNSAIKRIGDEALTTILRPKQLTALKQLQAVIGDATIPVPRTTNPSGTGARVMNMMNRLFTFPGLTGKIAAFVSAGSNALRDQAERQLVLEGIEKGASSLQRSRGFLQLATSIGLRGAALEELERE